MSETECTQEKYIAAMCRLRTIAMAAPTTESLSGSVSKGLLQAIADLAAQPLDAEAEFVSAYLSDLDTIREDCASLAEELWLFSRNEQESAAVSGLWEEPQ